MSSRLIYSRFMSGLDHLQVGYLPTSQPAVRKLSSGATCAQYLPSVLLCNGANLGLIRRLAPSVLDAKTPASRPRIMPRLEGCLDSALKMGSNLHRARLVVDFEAPITPKHGP